MPVDPNDWWWEETPPSQKPPTDDKLRTIFKHEWQRSKAKMSLGLNIYGGVIEIVVDHADGRVWVNFNGECCLAIQQAEKISIVDHKDHEEELPQSHP